MMNNAPLTPAQVIQTLRAGGNPNTMMRMMIQQHPVVKQAAQFMNGKTPDQIREAAYQLAAQRGVDIEQLTRQLGIQLPK